MLKGSDNIARLDLKGRRFGRLTVLDEAGRDQWRHLLWKCKCDCGAIRLVTQWNLVAGITVSCGCYAKDRASKQLKQHGLSSNRFFETWTSMMKRCYNPNCSGYYRYGGRGICVCDEWHDVKTFIDWCESQNPPENMQIDRIDNDGNYSPDNCRFVTIKENNNNRSSCMYITFQGRTQSLTKWCEELGLPYGTMRSRIHSLHWDPDKAFLTPVNKQRSRDVSKLP